MGAIYVDVTIRNPADHSRSWCGPFLVDTGATDTVVPRQHLEAIGITPRGQRTYQLADGRQVQMDRAVARIELLDDIAGGTVVFGDADAEPLLGSTVLASMGVEVDRQGQELRKLPSIPLMRLTRRAQLTFSQTHGYEPVPRMLQPEELNPQARMRIRNVLVDHVIRYRQRELGVYLFDMAEVSRDLHLHHDDVHPLESWTNDHDFMREQFIRISESLAFNKVFDTIQFVMRHPRCPPSLVEGLKKAFADSHLPYVIDNSGLPTIVPIATEEEGNAILSSLKQLADAELTSSAAYLCNASEHIIRGQWAHSIRESANAIESVAATLGLTTGFKDAVHSLGRTLSLHPALAKAILSLYGYASDEKGIRHAVREGEEIAVGRDEAVLMLGTCASIASYLSRKHSASS